MTKIASDQHDLNEKFFDLDSVLAAKFADGRVVDGSSFDEPPKITANGECFFKRPGGIDTAENAVQDHAAKNAGMNRRLTDASVVEFLPVGPIESFRKKNNLIACQLDRVPAAGLQNDSSRTSMPAMIARDSI